MLTTVHLLVGALIGKYFESALLVIILAFLSHYVLDMIPHASFRGPPECKKNPLSRDSLSKIPKCLFIEALLGIVLVLFLISFNKNQAYLMFLGMLFAWLPDLLSFIAWRHEIVFLNKTLPRPGNMFYNESKSLFGFLSHLIVGAAAFIALLFSF